MIIDITKKIWVAVCDLKMEIVDENESWASYMWTAERDHF